MAFSTWKSNDNHSNEQVSVMFRVIQLLLEGCALHSVEFDSVKHAAFRTSIREIANRFQQDADPKNLVTLVGDINKTVRTYNHVVERFIQELSVEKQQAVKLLAQSLLRVCQASEQSAQTLREIENELASASELDDMRKLRAKMAECVASICQEADAHEARYRELKEHISQSSTLLEPRDQVTGLGALKSANFRIQELSSGASPAHVMAFFLKNIDVVNRRFGFAAGDDVLRRFSLYLAKHLRGTDHLFRWRGPCFVIVTDRIASSDVIHAEAKDIALRGPDQEVESGGKSMLIRLIAATATFPIPKGQGASELSEKIDQFAAEQFKLAKVTSR
jgi:GGDEF domain-containing protein